MVMAGRRLEILSDPPGSAGTPAAAVPVTIAVTVAPVLVIAIVPGPAIALHAAVVAPVASRVVADIAPHFAQIAAAFRLGPAIFAAIVGAAKIALTVALGFADIAPIFAIVVPALRACRCRDHGGSDERGDGKKKRTHTHSPTPNWGSPIKQLGPPAMKNEPIMRPVA